MKRISVLFILIFTLTSSCSVFKSINPRIPASTIEEKESYSVINGESYKIIQEILLLGRDEIIPSEIYQRFDSRLIAASLVRRLHMMQELETENFDAETDFFKIAHIQMRFNPEYIDSIKKNGFLNLHQVNHSNGDFSRDNRAHNESAFLRIKFEKKYLAGIENPVNQLRPKYSYLTFENNLNGEHAPDFRNVQYGSVVATFKDEIKYRSTFTPEDSLGTFGKTLRTFFFRSDELIRMRGSFWEAQIWGQLTLSDVKHLLINCPNEIPISITILKDLKKVGLPIYKCEFAEDRSHFEKGKIIFRPKLQNRLKDSPLVGTETQKLKLK